MEPLNGIVRLGGVAVNVGEVVRVRVGVLHGSPEADARLIEVCGERVRARLYMAGQDYGTHWFHVSQLAVIAPRCSFCGEALRTGWQPTYTMRGRQTVERGGFFIATCDNRECPVCKVTRVLDRHPEIDPARY